LIIWITGLSGAGKTTLCEAISNVVKPCMPQLVTVDGDVIRDLFGNDLDYSEKSRVVQISRIQRVAKFLNSQKMVVLVAALYANPELLRWNRANLAPYFEVYLDAPLDLVRARDAKGIYARADRGEAGEVVGMDIRWQAPQAPDLRIDCTAGASPDHMARDVIAAVPVLATALAATEISR
jgi:adenylylsulfate kinase-like enzyme